MVLLTWPTQSLPHRQTLQLHFPPQNSRWRLLRENFYMENCGCLVANRSDSSFGLVSHTWTGHAQKVDNGWVFGELKRTIMRQTWSRNWLTIDVWEMKYPDGWIYECGNLLHFRATDVWPLYFWAFYLRAWTFYRAHKVYMVPSWFHVEQALHHFWQGLSQNPKLPRWYNLRYRGFELLFCGP